MKSCVLITHEPLNDIDSGRMREHFARFAIEWTAYSGREHRLLFDRNVMTDQLQRAIRTSPFKIAKCAQRSWCDIPTANRLF